MSLLVDAMLLQGGDDRHWLRVERRDERAIPVRGGGVLRYDRVVDAFRFEDVRGIEVQIFREMAQMPRPPAPTGVSISSFLPRVLGQRHRSDPPSSGVRCSTSVARTRSQMSRRPCTPAIGITIPSAS